MNSSSVPSLQGYAPTHIVWGNNTCDSYARFATAGDVRVSISTNLTQWYIINVLISLEWSCLLRIVSKFYRLRFYFSKFIAWFKGTASSGWEGRFLESSLRGAMTVTRLDRAQRSRMIVLKQACTLHGSRGVRNTSLPSEIFKKRPLSPIDYAIPLIMCST